MKPDVTLYPVHVGRFSARTVAARAHGCRDCAGIHRLSACKIDTTHAMKNAIKKIAMPMVLAGDFYDSLHPASL
jgi:hypothetical protein